MIGYLKCDFKRAFGLRFFLSLALFVGLKYISIRNEMSIYIGDDSSLMYLSQFVLSDMFLGVFAAICLIPFGGAYGEDLATGFYKYHTIKGDREAYINSKLLTLALSSFLCGLLSYFIIYLILYRYFPIADSSKLIYGLERPIYLYESSRPLVFLFIMTSLRALYLAFLGVISYFINLFSRNKLLLFMLPSFIYIFSSRVLRFMRQAMGLSPINLDLVSQGRLNGSSAFITSLVSVGLLVLAIVCVNILSYKKMEWELKI